MKSKVFFLAGEDEITLKKRFPELLERLIDREFSANTWSGIKVHFGEKGNVTFVPADYSRITVKYLKEKGAKPFLFETNTLYHGQRSNTVDHLNLAAEHGFSPSRLGAPVVIADGIRGEGSAIVPVCKKHVEEAHLGSMVPEIPVLVGISHFKGHMLTGFGATIKNFSMGTAARKGKLFMHSLSKPWIDNEKCTQCGACAEQCAAEAIVRDGDDFVILKDKCTGCAECLGVCPVGAVKIHWDEASESASEKMAEYALAACGKKPGFYVNFLINITKDCDCLGKKMKPVTANVGIIASRDPVAADQAGFDLVEKTIRSAHPDVNPEVQLAHAERIGLGKRDYEMEEL
ncbi:DUF362 domain-containing protein [candidate division WOR-3 bacterium]|uniref:DUF362 domain-containing protein n=1 Tax=candidate division WOR-3 bacterium TaxID=2052148 RepID=A0A9D5K8M5_UNCW3|nr:DUF362 domain-containing protein [candidate division WOR-3 bacterium]MBD3364352.1 DUF362 domain-containing protein [candidate division WOR-3 bacterium]